MQATIIDTRAKWMTAEDGEYYCRTFCPMYKRCASKIGQKCKHQGGTEIPKMRRCEK